MSCDGPLRALAHSLCVLLVPTSGTLAAWLPDLDFLFVAPDLGLSSMPYAAIKRATGGMSELAQAMAVPHEHKPQRIPSFPNLERTSVVQTVATDTLPVASNLYRDFTLVRSPTYPLWTTCKAATGPASLGYSATPATGNGFGSLAAAGATINLPNDPFTAYFANGADTTFLKAMSRRYPLARARDGRTFLISNKDGQAAISLVFSGTLAANCTLIFEVWDGSGETTIVNVHNVSISGTSLSLPLSNELGGGFWRLASIQLNAWTSGNPVLSSFSCGVLTGGTLATPTFTGPGLNCYCPVFAPPEFTSSRIPYGSTRANAAAVLLSNVTAVLDKEGTISCARVPRTSAPGCFYGGYLYGTSFTTLISSVYPKDRYFGPMEKGLYAYTLPDSSTDGFTDCVSDSVHPDGFPAPIFNLESFEYVSLITMSDLGGNGSTIAVTQDAHLEFRSSSMLFPVGFSQTTLEAYHVAQMALAQQGVFFENPVHLAAITSLIRAAVSRLAPVVMPYAKTAAVAIGNKLLSSAVGSLNTRMSQVGLQPAPRPAPRAKPRAAKKRVVPGKRKK